MFLKFINNSIQKFLDNDPEIATSLEEFNNQCLVINLTDIKQSFLIEIKDSKVTVSVLPDPEELKPSTTIFANIITLLRLGLGADYQGLINDGDLRVDGDVELASRLRELFMDIDIDWEEIASKYVGDTVAYQLGVFTRRFKKYKQRSVENFRLDVSEYLQEESRLVPTKIELEKFFNDVDQLEADLDRLEARTSRLNQEIN